MVVLINPDLDDLRATLEHTWLKRRLLTRVRAERAEWLKAVGTGSLPKVLAGIPARIKETRKLLACLIEGYSPAQLVDLCPLAALPHETKKIIKGAVHKAYLDSGVIQPLAAQLRGALDEFEAEAAEIGPAWTGAAGAKKIDSVLDGLETAAERLRQALLDLPREVVLS